jgi:hypothetical protein
MSSDFVSSWIVFGGALLCGLRSPFAPLREADLSKTTGSSKVAKLSVRRKDEVAYDSDSIGD